MAGGVVAVDQRPVAVVEPRLPGGHDDEPAPVGAAASRTGVGGYVGQTAPGAHGVVPCLHPVAVERGRTAEGLQDLGGRVTVAAVSGAFEVGAVDHVPVVGQAAQRVRDHVVDGVQVAIRRSERRFGPVVGVDGERPEILPAGPLRQSAHLGVTESVVVELVAEPLPAVAAGDVGVALPLVDEVAVAVRLVAVFDLDARPVRKPREMSLQPAGDDLAEVDPPYAGCRLVQHAGGQPLLDAVGLDHLRRRPVPGLPGRDYRLPCQRVQVGGGHRARVAPGVDLFASEVEGVPRPRVAVAAQRGTPCGVRAAGGLPGVCGAYVQLCPHKRFGVGFVGLPASERAALVPTLPEPDHQLVVAFEQVGTDIVGHPQRAFVELREGGGEAGVADFAAVDPYFVVSQRIDVQQRFVSACREGECPAQEHGRGARFRAADEFTRDGCRVGQADAEAGDGGDGFPVALFGARSDAPPALRPGRQRKPLVGDSHRTLRPYPARVPQVGVSGQQPQAVRGNLDPVAALGIAPAPGAELPPEAGCRRVDGERIGQPFAGQPPQAGLCAVPGIAGRTGRQEAGAGKERGQQEQV